MYPIIIISTILILALLGTFRIAKVFTELRKPDTQHPKKQQ